MLEVGKIVQQTNKADIVKQVEALNNLSGTARKIYEILAKEGPIKSKTISEKYDMSVRTVRYNLSRLVERNVVRRIPDIADTRGNYYRLI